MRAPETLHEALVAAFRAKGRVLVAFSGGVDSAVLAKINAEQGGLAVIVDSESYAREEKDDAVAFATAAGIPHEVVWHSELADAEYAANPVNRCYFCRKGLGEVMLEIAAARDYDAVAVGTNQDDLSDWRPGTQAIREKGLWQPFVELAVTKDEVRALARHLGLPVWDKPSMACLSSRIPYGEPVTLGKLTRIGQAESLLRARGFRQVRVRTLEEGATAAAPPQGADGSAEPSSVARIEVEPHEIARLRALLDDITPAFRLLGYARVEVDERGYRPGALNEMVVRIDKR